MSAMCDVSATETAIIYGMEPVWGAGFAWFLLGERWGPTGWIGASLVLGNIHILYASYQFCQISGHGGATVEYHGEFQQAASAISVVKYDLVLAFRH